MKLRLNVTEGERLHYSRRRLHALSALRHAGIDPCFGLYKDQRVPDSGRRSYRVDVLGGSQYYFPRLADVAAFAADYALWRQTRCRAHAIPCAFDPWRTDPLNRMLVLVTAGLWSEEQATRPAYTVTQVPLTLAHCSWPGCPYPARGVQEGQALCAGHAWYCGPPPVAQQRAGKG